MDDRQLLEKAAQAAGMVLMYEGSQSPEPLWWPEGSNTFPTPWNPLEDDGDALRLAVKLRMHVEPWGAGASAVVSVDNRAMVAEPHYGDDPDRATRRAIVRAAASMTGEKR